MKLRINTIVVYSVLQILRDQLVLVLFIVAEETWSTPAVDGINVCTPTVEGRFTMQFQYLILKRTSKKIK